MSKLLEWQHALAALPPAIVVTRFEPGGIGQPPRVELIVDGFVEVCAYRADEKNWRGDVQYAVRYGRLPISEGGIHLWPKFTETMVTVEHDDPRGLIAGMVDEIGKAALHLARAN